MEIGCFHPIDSWSFLLPVKQASFSNSMSLQCGEVIVIDPLG